MKEEINLSSIRTRKAKLHGLLSSGFEATLLWVSIGLVIAAGYYFVLSDVTNIGYFALSMSVAIFMFLLWGHYDLKKLAVKQPAKQLDDIIEARLLANLAKVKGPLTPKRAWEAVTKTQQAVFLCNHLLLPPTAVTDLSDNPQDMKTIWKQTLQLMDHRIMPELHGGTLAAALIFSSPAAGNLLTSYKLQSKDLVETLSWLDRHLAYLQRPRPNFGGIGRDWANGFTPTLENFSQNLSSIVEREHGYANFYAHADLFEGIISNLERDTAVALVGPEGSGKTTIMYGLAHRLLEGQSSHLAYYQVVSLNASLILSYSDQQLEKLMLTLFSEGMAAGNIILFLDDAQLFFNSGVGSFDMSQVLLPVLKNRRLKIVAAFNNNDWQRLQANRQALANSFTSVTVNESNEAATFKILEDEALILEHQNKVLISYEALSEAYRLSGQYLQEEAYPGKAIRLVEQALSYAHDGILTAQSLQAAIEQTKGVKVSAAGAPEAEMLLNLENRIHERMINQTRAVNVVAAALRRGRAGVSSPKRPVGSFLFLGPTGVGKTELARSLAGVYFGDERQMIRLDMSEYQRPEDVGRLLSGGGQNNKSLLLAIRQQPFSVVLFDEIEKAHPNILNLFLQMLDEGQLTDEQGRPASFRSSIIIATSNAGASDIAAQVKAGQTLDDFERPLVDKLIANGQFKPELVNRFDEVVLFRPLNEEELAQVANIMLTGVNQTLSSQQISVALTPEALKHIVHLGYDPEFGARPMRRIIQKTVENAVAVKILRGEAKPGSTITLDTSDLAAS